MSDQHGTFTSSMSASAANAVSSIATTAASSSSLSICEVEHVCYLSDHIGSLYLSDDYSDITLIVGSQYFRAHKVILACRSQYFRALLYGGMREANASEIDMNENNIEAFKILLRYIYTGRINLNTFKEEIILDILGLAHKYGFNELESAISDYLRAILNTLNLCLIFGASHMYSLQYLRGFCLEFADRHAQEVLNTDGFFHLSASAVKELISRDSFCAPEIEIFRALREWANQNSLSSANSNDSDAIFSENCSMQSVEVDIFSDLRLPLMRMEDLLNIVRPSGLISSDQILDAIKEQTEKRAMDLKYRGFLLSDTNIATPSHGAQVIEGEMKQSLLNGDITNYDMERGFCRHPIDDCADGIMVQLGTPCIINHIRLLLWDKDARSYSYYIEVSIDKRDWIRIVDYSHFCCRSWQKLYFAAKVVRYIKVVGTNNTVNRVFHLVALEAMYSTQPLPVDAEHGVIIPEENIATISNSACVLEGVSRSRNALLNGDTSNYDWDSGYTCHQLHSGAILVQLPQPYVIGSMRLLLWDCDDRSYSYYVEVSLDQTTWTRVTDKSSEPCRSWQCLNFDALPISFIKIVGTHNTANEVFHCVHFECPAQQMQQLSNVESFSVDTTNSCEFKS